MAELRVAQPVDMLQSRNRGCKSDGKLQERLWTKEMPVVSDQPTENEIIEELFCTL